MLRLSDMTWVEQAYNICFLGPPGIGKTHLALSLAVKRLDLGYAVAFETLDNLMKLLKTEEISGASKRRLKYLYKAALVIVDEVGFMPLRAAEEEDELSHAWINHSNTSDISCGDNMDLDGDTANSYSDHL